MADRADAPHLRRSISLGRVATGHRAHLVTGLVSAMVIAGLAFHTMLA